ncbi:Fic family protein [Calditrichota bacterium LG25]
MGRADELGSGVRNLSKYYHAFSDRPPELIEGDIFKIVVDVSKIARQVTPQATPQDERIKRILAFCEKPRSREEIQKFTGLKDRKYFRRNILNPLVEKGLLLLTIPEKPNSPNQKYYSKKNNGKIIPHFTPRVTPQATPQAPPQVTPQAGEKIEGLNEELKQLLEIIKINPGIQVKDIPALLANRSLKTIERQLKVLKEKSLIERRGSRKTGGYYLKEN